MTSRCSSNQKISSRPRVAPFTACFDAGGKASLGTSNRASAADVSGDADVAFISVYLMADRRLVSRAGALRYPQQRSVSLWNPTMLRHREDLRPLFFHAVYFVLLVLRVPARGRRLVECAPGDAAVRDRVSGRGADTQRHPLAGVSWALAQQGLPGGAHAHLRPPRQFLCAGAQPESPQTYPDPPGRDADDEDPLPLQRLQRAVLLLRRGSQHHAGGRAVHGRDAQAPSLVGSGKRSRS